MNVIIQIHLKPESFAVTQVGPLIRASAVNKKVFFNIIKNSKNICFYILQKNPYNNNNI